MLRPPCILHLHSNEADDRAELVSLCSSALHFSKGERKLMEYYSSCSSGFRPALTVIADKIGIDKRSVARLRQNLVEHGIALLDRGRLFIDWSRVRLFSTLDPHQTSKHDYIAPVELKSGLLTQLEKLYKTCELDTLPIDEQCNLLSMLDEHEYEVFRNYVSRHKSSRLKVTREEVEELFRNNEDRFIEWCTRYGIEPYTVDSFEKPFESMYD